MTTTDQPFFDPTAYGNGPDDNVTDTSEGMAITHHTVRIGGRDIAYTAHAGHLVTVDPSSSQPVAKMFHVAFVADAPEGGAQARPVTFFYNGGPGSSAVFVLLGSFAPRRIVNADRNGKNAWPYSAGGAVGAFDSAMRSVRSVSNQKGSGPMLISRYYMPSRRRVIAAATSPTTAATPPSTSASAKSCMTSRPRLAPSALRTVSSVSRVAARAKSSRATLPQISVSSAMIMTLIARLIERSLGDGSSSAT